MENKEATRIFNLVNSIYKYAPKREDTHKILETKERIEKSFSSEFAWSVVPVPYFKKVYPIAYDKAIMLKVGCMYRLYITAIKKCPPWK